MNKEERRTYIRKQAIKYAQTGEFIDSTDVEAKLKVDGWIEAREIINSRFMKNKLNNICNIARSPEEQENKENFMKWIQAYVSIEIRKMNVIYPKITFIQNQVGFTLKNDFNDLEVRKCFGGKYLVSTLRFLAKNNRSYKTKFVHKDLNNYDVFKENDLVSLCKIVNTQKLY